MPARQAILDGIGELAAELGHRGTVDLEARLAEDLGLDSLGLLTLAAAVENRFRVCLDEDDESRLVTVGDLVRLLEGKLGA